MTKWLLSFLTSLVCIGGCAGTRQGPQLDGRAPPAAIAYAIPDLEALARVHAVLSSSGLAVESTDTTAGVVITKWNDYEAGRTVSPAKRPRNYPEAYTGTTKFDLRRVRFTFHLGRGRCVVVPEAEGKEGAWAPWRQSELTDKEREHYKRLLKSVLDAMTAPMS